MGLDIRYYSNVSPMDVLFNEDGDPIDPQTKRPIQDEYYQAIDNPHYDRSDGVRGVYSFEGSDGFRAGSYTGYNHWRNQLAELAGYPCIEEEGHQAYSAGAWQAEYGPFWEMIMFSDCEGTIGPKTSAKLAKDFADYQTKADAHESDNFRQVYGDFRKAFKTAANNGAVSFQ